MVSSIEFVIQLLNNADVRYIIVGGVDVVLHGHLRTTADLDLVIDLSDENSKKAIGALEEAGFQPRTPVPANYFAQSSHRRAWVEQKGLIVFSLWSPNHPGLEVDLLSKNLSSSTKRMQERFTSSSITPLRRLLRSRTSFGSRKLPTGHWTGQT